MTFLPIVGRELRVRARKPSTRRVRLAAAFIALVVAAVFAAQNQWTASNQTGQDLFKFLSFLILVFCFFEGLRNTCDCLSEEIREGTIGLLFLTDLKGYDVTFGKLSAAALNSVYGLAAVLPVLALSLLSGGVTFGEFCRTALAIANALFLSLSTGIWVSARSRDSQKNALASFGTLALLVVGFPLIDLTARQGGLSPDNAILACASPAFGFHLATDVMYQAHALEFWKTFGIVHATGWLLLGWAAAHIRTAWVSAPVETPRMFRRRKRSGNDIKLQGSLFSISRRKNARRLMDVNPFLWLAAQFKSITVWIWASAFLLALYPLIWNWIASGGFPMRSVAPLLQIAGYVCNGLFQLAVILLACRFLAESRKAGVWELIFTTPVRTREIIHGQWLYLRRILTGPVLLLAGGHLVLTLAFWMILEAKERRQIPGEMEINFYIGAIGALLPIAVVFAEVLAMAWAGMWLGLSSRSLMNAMAKTFILTAVVPWLMNRLLLSQLLSLLVRKYNGASVGYLFSYSSSGLTLAINLAIAFWARNRIYANFRAAALGRHLSKSNLFSPRIAMSKFKEFGLPKKSGF